MEIFSVVILLALSCVLSTGTSSSLQQPLGAELFEFRPPRADDAGDIATVIIDAFSRAPAWKYVHQFADEYPGYIRSCLERNIKRTLENNTSSEHVSRVISVPDHTTVSGSRVVSFSDWQFNRTKSHPDLFTLAMLENGGNCSKHLDSNQTRSEDYMKHLKSAVETHLDNVYERHVYLSLIATHPKWDGNGFAAVHLRWGMGLADEMELPTTLIATPAGYPLYKSVGFEDIYNDTLERLDGEGIIWHEVMKHSP
ncbi:hypothetical protein TruAng_006003 [Truncatella angustata]|nr:hypothetical protein TruAng_006003 [Truncatella angustata]